LTRLAEALLPILQQEEGNDEAALASANEALATFSRTFENFQLAGFRHKLGLLSEREGDLALVQDLLDRMATNSADFTLTFRRLCDAAATPESDKEVRSLFTDSETYDLWAIGWRQQLKEESVSGVERAESMRKVNPAFIPRNHLVEAAINAAVEREDFQPFEELLEITSRPYEDKPG
jgi:uncharacterized protein YdiU (UPF0061 family)